MRRRVRGGDVGAGTVWMVAAMGVVWGMAVVLMSAGGIRAARHRAYTAADQAALAGAKALAQFQAGACVAARKVAERSGAVVTRCGVSGRVVDVEVVVVVRGVPFVGEVRVPARARAGPSDEPP